MAGVQHVGADFFAALDEYVQDASRAARIASDVAVETLRQSVTEDAKRHPAWADAADHIEVWNDKKGRLQVGVRNPDVLEAAHKAEFGSRKNPPVPVLRNNRRATSQADNALRYTFGYLTGGLR